MGYVSKLLTCWSLAAAAKLWSLAPASHGKQGHTVGSGKEVWERAC